LDARRKKRLSMRGVDMDRKTGERVTIRRLWAADRDRLAAHLLRLDRASRRQRFTGGVSDALILNYVARSFAPGDIVYGAFSGGELRGAGELRPDTETCGRGYSGCGPARAETALSVEEPYRRRGCGTALLGRIVGAAGIRNLDIVEFTCGVENEAMRRLAERFAADLSIQGDQVTGRLVPYLGASFSYWRETSRDMAAYAAAILASKRRGASLSTRVEAFSS
jgi:GNAT superfamily N-acetyltransferase